MEIAQRAIIKHLHTEFLCRHEAGSWESNMVARWDGLTLLRKP